MSNITKHFEQSEFALAAYSSLFPGMTRDAYEVALQQEGKGLSPAQAAKFASTYTVVAQYNDTPAEGGSNSGLSVTIFESKDGQKHLAIRGTNDLQDLLSDIVDIALLGSTQLQAQYTSLKAKVTEWIGNGTLSSSFTVTGHSLGGFLATGITADFASNVSHTYLYNAPGIGGMIGTFLSALGVSVTTVDATKISNLKAQAGPHLIAGLGAQVSTPITVEIEDQTASGITNPPVALNHSQQILTDALAVQTIYAVLDPNLTQEQLNTLDAVRQLLLGSSLHAAYGHAAVSHVTQNNARWEIAA